MTENPWLVENFQAFSFLNCPECNFKSKENIPFKSHAVKNHPLSSVFFMSDSCQNSQNLHDEKTLEELMYPDSDLEESMEIEGVQLENG